ncbi:MAG: hypothetical protein VZR00_07590, partial [Lachnospiraceae bacterium]|nr:hypothetical protein [Lachnospiraceae bacterium]
VKEIIEHIREMLIVPHVFIRPNINLAHALFPLSIPSSRSFDQPSKAHDRHRIHVRIHVLSIHGLVGVVNMFIEYMFCS